MDRLEKDEYCLRIAMLVSLFEWAVLEFGYNSTGA
jgi:hypothetical protein